MIISQIYFEKQWENRVNERTRNWPVRAISCFSYILLELSLCQLALLNTQDVPFTLVVAITMAFRRKDVAWWWMLGLTPLFIYSTAYLTNQVSASHWWLWLPTSIIMVGICLILVHIQAKDSTRYIIAISAASLVEIIDMLLEGVKIIPSHALALVIGTGVIIVLEMIRLHEEKANQQKMHALVVESERDGLTGLLNYRAFNQEIGSLSKDKNIQTIVIGALDIDHFKHINDTYGHLNGNDVLSDFSTTLKAQIHQAFPHHGYIYRFGGEEFTIVVSNHSIERVNQLMDKMELYFRKHTIRTRDKFKIKISFSCSLTLHHEGESLDTTLKRADRLLYHVKNHGRGWVIVNKNDRKLPND